MNSGDPIVYHLPIFLLHVGTLVPWTWLRKGYVQQRSQQILRLDICFSLSSDQVMKHVPADCSLHSKMA